MISPNGETSGADFRVSLEKLFANLDADARVQKLVKPDLSESGVGFRMLPQSMPGGEDDPMMPDDHMHVARLRSPATFHVQMPRRLQADKNGREGVPSDEYWVAWDGMSMVSLWEFEEYPESLGAAGGRAALAVLGDAADAAGLELVVPPCSPNCDYPFAHADLVVREATDHVFEYKREPESYIVDVLSPEVSSPDKAVLALMHNISFTAWSFAELRSDGLAVVSAESAARDALGELLELNYRRASTSTLPFVKGLGLRWSNRGWRKRAHRLLASLWLSLATLEARQHSWVNKRFIYDNAAQEENQRAVFQAEYGQEINLVGAVNVGGIVAAAEQASARLDTRTLSWATSIGAVGGGIVGALLTKLFS